MLKSDKDPVNLMLGASGGGTDADSIMQAWKKGQIPEVGNIVLFSTHAGAGCLEKAAACGVKALTLVPPSIPLKDHDHIDRYRRVLRVVSNDYGSELLFLVGCRVILPLIHGVSMYNIHPADPDLHGGDGMHSLTVHEHVLAVALDQIRRGKKKIGEDRFFTYPTIHEVTAKPDDGPPLLQGSVEIPWSLLSRLQTCEQTLQQAAEELQKLVLPYEWQILPTAVRMAARRIMTV